MQNRELMTVKAAAQAKAAGLQHEVAQAVPHGFRATTEERARHWMERDVEQGMWEAQHRSAAAATSMFLREHDCSPLTGRKYRRR